MVPVYLLRLIVLQPSYLPYDFIKRCPQQLQRSQDDEVCHGAEAARCVAESRDPHQQLRATKEGTEQGDRTPLGRAVMRAGLLLYFKGLKRIKAKWKSTKMDNKTAIKDGWEREIAAVSNTRRRPAANSVATLRQRAYVQST